MRNWSDLTALRWRVRHRLRRIFLRQRRFDRLEEGFAFGPPTQPPRLTRQQAIHLAMANPPATATIQAEYGRYRHVRRRRGVVQSDGRLKYQLPPAFNAWKVTVTGVSMPRPGRSRIKGRPLPVTAMVIIVDDQKGAVDSATGE